ncbi:MAG: hypothetical protein N4A47_05435 [Clostridia bacterium]|nr:hypothetical protein [Clostridia bacterium]
MKIYSQKGSFTLESTIIFPIIFFCLIIFMKLSVTLYKVELFRILINRNFNHEKMILKTNEFGLFRNIKVEIEDMNIYFVKVRKIKGTNNRIIKKNIIYSFYDLKRFIDNEKVKVNYIDLEKRFRGIFELD